jgi:hypothetical protein
LALLPCRFGRRFCLQLLLLLLAHQLLLNLALAFLRQSRLLRLPDFCPPFHVLRVQYPCSFRKSPRHRTINLVNLLIFCEAKKTL